MDLLAAKRLRSVLRAHGVATERTLEQKIADAGPGDQRIDPHVLTRVRAALLGQGEVIQTRGGGAPWYHLRTTPNDVVQERLAELQPIYARTRDGNFAGRVGQALEIAIFRALRELHAASPEVEFFGGFRDLEAHDDSRRYSRIEPDMISGEHIGGGWVDFVVTTPDGGRGAIEAKNKRQWMYPGRKEIAELLEKALDLDAVPILIARRIPFVTFHLLSSCGVLFHQTYNQLYPEADAELATQAKDKRLLGYHAQRSPHFPHRNSWAAVAFRPGRPLGDPLDECAPAGGGTGGRDALISSGSTSFSPSAPAISGFSRIPQCTVTSARSSSTLWRHVMV